MIKRLMHIILALVMALLLVGAPPVSRLEPINAEDEDLLLNGDFEGRFLTYPHGPYGWDYVAEHWSRWWIHGTPVPEFTDAGWARLPYEGNHAQIYHSHPDYTAGVFQVVTDVTACRPYQLAMYTKTNSGEEVTLPHSRIGLDPHGTQLTDDGAVENALPSPIAWSDEQRALGVWEELKVITEPVGSKLTAILYAAPRPSPTWDETYWDAGSLIPASYESGRLPEPVGISDFIYDVSVVTETESVTINWHTTEAPAATQVWYEVFTPATAVTDTTTMTHTAYLPLISRDDTTSDYATGISFMRATEHQALINGLNPGQGIKFIIVARRLNGDTCETVRSESRIAVTGGDSQ